MKGIVAALPPLLAPDTSRQTRRKLAEKITICEENEENLDERTSAEMAYLFREAFLDAELDEELDEISMEVENFRTKND